MQLEKKTCGVLVCLFALVGVLGAANLWAQGPRRPQRPVHSPRISDAPMPRALAASAPSSGAESTIYVETFGTDSPRCGNQRLPCRTINYGLVRAKQIQQDPPMPVTEVNSFGPSGLMTVQVGPGTFEERVTVTFDWVRIQGAGAGSTIITAGHEEDYSGHAMDVYGQGVYLDGLTFSDSDGGVWSLAGGQVFVTNSSFIGNVDAFVAASSYGFAQYCTFTNNLYSGESVSSSRMHLWDVTISGSGIGTGSEGVLSYWGSSLRLLSNDPAMPVTITNTDIAIEVGQDGYLDTNYVSVTGNDIGMYTFGNALAFVRNSTFANSSSFGMVAEVNSALWAANTEVSNSAIWGIYLFNFSHASLHNMTFSNNGGGTDDVYAEPGTFSGYLLD